MVVVREAELTAPTLPFLSLFLVADLAGREKLKSKAAVLEMRRDKDVHDWFMRTIVPKVCGRKKFSLRGSNLFRSG